METGIQRGNGCVIRLNPVLKALLQQKLRAFTETLENSRCSFEVEKSIFYRHILLDRLLAEGHILGQEVEHELRLKFGTCFDPREFAEACIAIDDYNTTGGKNL